MAVYAFLDNLTSNRLYCWTLVGCPLTHSMYKLKKSARGLQLSIREAEKMMCSIFFLKKHHPLSKSLTFDRQYGEKKVQSE